MDQDITSELYEACQAALDFISGFGGRLQGEPIITQLESAIGHMDAAIERAERDALADAKYFAQSAGRGK